MLSSWMDFFIRSFISIVPMYLSLNGFVLCYELLVVPAGTDHFFYIVELHLSYYLGSKRFTQSMIFTTGYYHFALATIAHCHILCCCGHE